MNLLKNILSVVRKLRTLFTPKMALIAVAAALAITPALAQQKVSASFLNGSYLVIPPQSTNTTPGVGTFASTNSWTYAKYWYTTNTAVTITNPANGLIINGYQSSYLPVYVTNGNAFADVDLWVNQDGSLPSIGLCAVYTSYEGTNQTISPVFTLSPIAVSPDPSVPGLPTIVETNAANTFTFTGPTLQFTNIIAIETNLPTPFLQGEHRLRLTITNPNNGTNNAISVLGVWLRGFRPQPSL